jgi:hypothetical protein
MLYALITLVDLLQGYYDSQNQSVIVSHCLLLVHCRGFSRVYCVSEASLF